MSGKTDTGGNAFPNERFGEHGMSLLDWFAGQTLAAIMSIEDVHLNAGESEVAQWAYDQAEAMIEEKRRRESQ